MSSAESAAMGVLYLCATPIGNMEDMTYRAVRLLGEADLIAAEDTRHTRKLLAHYDIHTPLVSYHEHNKDEQGAYLIGELKRGKTVVLVSDAGMPVVADPGADLVRLCIAANIKTSPLPGANAALAALVCAGLNNAENFRFVGFLPKTVAKRKDVLNKLATDDATLIFYEAPHRLTSTLTEIYAAFGNRRAVIARELTKKFEEFRRGTLENLCRFYEETEPRGEFVLLVSGYRTENLTKGGQIAAPQDLLACYEEFLRGGFSHKDALRETAKKMNVGRREVYNAVLASKNNKM